MATEHELNIDVLIHIFSQLSAVDLVRASCVNRLWHAAADANILWRNLCEQDWLLTQSTPTVSSWQLLYKEYHSRFSRYGSAYKSIKKAWVSLEQVFSERCPALYQTLAEGATEEMIDEAERRLGVRIPLDLRCSYLFHNGQKFAAYPRRPGQMMDAEWGGLFGSVKVYETRISLLYASLNGLKRNGSTMLAFAHQVPEDEYQYAVMCETIPSDSQPLIKEPPFPVGTVVQPNEQFCYLLAPSFTVFLEDFASKVVNSNYDFVTGPQHPEERGIDRHLFSPSNMPSYDGIIYGSEAVTNGVRIRVSTSFNGEVSHLRLSDPVLEFSYRIKLSMDEGPYNPVQLVSRHWRIYGGDGSLSPVDGPGVIGYFPILIPGGRPFFYESRTSSLYVGQSYRLPEAMRQNASSMLFSTAPNPSRWLQPTLSTRRTSSTSSMSSREKSATRQSQLVGVMQGTFTFRYIPSSEVATRSINRSPNDSPTNLSGDFDALVAPFRLVSPAFSFCR